jgi:mevalonate kinase
MDPVAAGHPVDLNTELQTILMEHTQLPAHPQQSAVVTFLYLYLLAATQTNQWPGVTFCTRSTLPIGAGLGSSASYCVCVAAAIRHLFGLEQSPSTSNEHGATVLGRINAWAFLAEKIIHGNPSGVDNTVSTFGK